MKRLIAILLICNSSWTQAIERDKLIHFGTSFALTTVLYLGTSALFNKNTPPEKHNKTVPFLWSAMGVQIAGIAYECSGGFDTNDLKANIAGSLGAGLTIWAFDL